MFRTALLRSARSVASKTVRRSAIARPVARSSLTTKSQFAPSQFQAVRCYSDAASDQSPTPTRRDEVSTRIIDLLVNFDKVSDPSKLSPTAHFSNDLGLDSLDTVEVVMAIEEEFSIEIPDKEADAIHSVDKAVEYILAQPDAQ